MITKLKEYIDTIIQFYQTHEKTINRTLLFLLVIFIFRKIVIHLRYRRNKDKSIAVIGTGPSGLLMTRMLNKKGYKNISLYGNFGENQVNTIIKDGIHIDTNACFFHAGYDNSVYKLCKEYKMDVETLDSYDFGYNKNNKLFIKKYEDDNYSMIDLIKFAYHSICCSIFKNITNSYNITALEYAKKHNMKWIFNQLFANGQLYGFLDNVSAYHLFEWYKPSTLFSLVFNFKIRGKYIISKGYEILFDKIFRDLKIKDYNDVKIKKVIKDKDTNKLTLIDESGNEIQKDKVLVCCPSIYLDTPIKEIIDTDTDIEYTKVFILCFTADKESPIGTFYEKHYLTEGYRNKITAFRYFGTDKDGKHLYKALGYMSFDITETELKEKVLLEIREKLRLEVFDIFYWKIHNYNIRFTTKALRQNKHKNCRNIQGKDNIWYSSGPFNHWDIDSIYEYNQKLINKYF